MGDKEIPEMAEFFVSNFWEVDVPPSQARILLLSFTVLCLIVLIVCNVLSDCIYELQGLPENRVVDQVYSPTTLVSICGSGDRGGGGTQ